MKHLLILISFLLLSSLLTSCEKNGQGTETYNDGDKYVGEFKDGKRHGQGTFTWSDGDKYIGKWKDGKYHGEGKQTSYNIDGSIDQHYVGEYENGEKHGHGFMVFTNEGTYLGGWKDGKRNGKGTYTYPNDEYEYVGEFKDSTMNGQGVLTFSTGTKYVGDWKEGKEWNTTHTDKDGTLLGMYKNGEWELKYGVMIFGTRNFELKWREEEWEGVESEENKDIVTYMGEVKNGVPNGQGTQLFPDGWKYVGEVWDGERWNGTTYDQDGNITEKYVNGKKIKQ